MNGLDNKLLQEQIGYYKARAVEYDDWYLRQGRYDYGKSWNTKWFTEVQELKAILKQFNPLGKVLELACGTGWWTEELIRYADSITAVDAVSEVIEINRRKLHSSKVEYLQADIFNFHPKSHYYDVVFFSFWISHIPEEKFIDFWQMVSLGLKPTGRVFFIDNLQSEKAIMSGRPLQKTEVTVSIRELKDSSKFKVIKIFYLPKDLKQKLKSTGWEVSVGTTPNYFIYGFSTSEG